MDENIITEAERGIVKISDEVVSVIAGLAAVEIKGVIGMSSGLVGGFTEILSGKKNLSKGVKVSVNEDSSVIDLYMVVEYGVKIHEVAEQVQKNVKKTVESMTGLNVSAVNVYVHNVVLSKTEKEEIIEN